MKRKGIRARALRVSLAPKTPFPFPFKRLLRRLTTTLCYNKGLGPDEKRRTADSFVVSYLPYSGTCFWILGSVSDSGTCFWILGSVLDSGKCFGFWQVFLDSGKCFGFWEVFCPYKPL